MDERSTKKTPFGNSDKVRRVFSALENRVAAPVFGPIESVTSRGAAAGLRAFTQTPATTSPKYEFFDDFNQTNRGTLIVE